MTRPMAKAIETDFVPEYPTDGAENMNSLYQPFNLLSKMPNESQFFSGYDEEFGPSMTVNELNSPGKTDIDITVPGKNHEFITEYEMGLEVQPKKRVDQTDWADNAAAAPADGEYNWEGEFIRPCVPHLMWQTVKLKNNLVRVDYDDDNLYFYKYFLDKVLNVKQKYIKSLKETDDFDLPSGEDESQIPIYANHQAYPADTWARRRQEKLKGRMRFITTPHLPLIKSNRVLPLGANINYTFIRNPSRCLFHVGDNAVNEPKSILYIHKMLIYVRRQGLKQKLIETMMINIDKAGEYIYNLSIKEIKSFQLTGNTMEVTQPIAYQGGKPTHVFIFFVNNAAAVGSTHIPMTQFANIDIRHARVSFDRNIYPPPDGYKFTAQNNELQLDNLRQFTLKNKAIWGVKGIDKEDRMFWTWDRFKNHFNIMVFDLTNGQIGPAGTSCTQFPEAGTIDVRIVTGANIPAGTTMYVATQHSVQLGIAYGTMLPALSLVGA